MTLILIFTAGKSVSWLSKFLRSKQYHHPIPVDDLASDDGATPSLGLSFATVKAILFHTKSNWLLVAFPIGVISFLCNAHPAVSFTFNAISIIPLSGLLTLATECVSADLGDTIGALMNISFGNLVELIILYVYVLPTNLEC
jgi:Ca2+:H+ antiporter